MRNKYYKTLIITLFILFCAVLLVTSNYVLDAVQTFKFVGNKPKKVELVMQYNNCYDELKQSLKEKYAKKFFKMLDETRVTFDGKLKSILGDDYMKTRQELVTIDNEIATIRKEFLSSSEYVSKKAELKEIKSKLDAIKEDNSEKEELQSKFNVALNELSTLNVKLNNQCKDKREKKDEIKRNLKKLFDQKQKALFEAKRQLELETRQKIAQILNEFNFELSELNDAFDIKSKIKEFPFDEANLNIESVATKFESDYFSGNLNDNVASDNGVKVEFVTLDGIDDVVISENPSKLKS